MRPMFPLLAVLLLISCSQEKELTLLTYEVNTVGVKHTVHYDNGLPTALLYETFHGSGGRDTTNVDSVLRREIDSVRYDDDARTALLERVTDGGPKAFRKYYFNADNLLTRITRFDGGSEYTTDSVSYDYTTRIARFYDLINKHVYELVYDNRNNIESETQRRISDQHLFQTHYYYYDASRNPFLVNLEEDEGLFGCFNYTTVGLFWNNASRPLFNSKNNVQSYKHVTAGEERNGLFEYQYRFGIPAAQFGTNWVIYYRYVHVLQ